MTPADAAELLALAAAFDRRTIGKADAIAWADALSGLDPADCAEAIRGHFRETDAYLMPIDVRRGVHAIRSKRLERHFEDFPELDGYADDPIEFQRRLRVLRRQVAAGTYRPTVRALPKRDVPGLIEQHAFPSPPETDNGDAARAKALRAHRKTDPSSVSAAKDVS